MWDPTHLQLQVWMPQLKILHESTKTWWSQVRLKKKKKGKAAKRTSALPLERHQQQMVYTNRPSTQMANTVPDQNPLLVVYHVT